MTSQITVLFNILLIKAVSWHLSKILQPSSHSQLVSTSLYWIWFKQNLTLMFPWSRLQRNTRHSLLSVLYTTLEICKLKKSVMTKVCWVCASQLRWLL